MLMDPIRLASLAEPGRLLSWHSIPYHQVSRLEVCATVLGFFHEFWESQLRPSCLYNRHLIEQVIPSAPRPGFVGEKISDWRRRRMQWLQHPLSSSGCVAFVQLVLFCL